MTAPAPLDLYELRDKADDGDLDALEALLAATSPAPWSEDDGNVFSKPRSDERHKAIRAKRGGKAKRTEHPRNENDDYPWGYVGKFPQGVADFEANALATCALRNAAPALVRRVRELEAALAAMVDASAALRLAESPEPWPAWEALCDAESTACELLGKPYDEEGWETRVRSATSAGATKEADRGGR